MTPRNFVYLAIAAVLSALFAVVSFASNNQWSTATAAGDKLFPKLASEASQIATIEVRQGEQDVVLERTGGSWVLKNRGNYPADPVKVRTLLVRLAQADLIESKTSRPDRYPALELQDPSEKDAKSRLVRLLAGNGGVVGEVVVGKRRFDVLGTGKGGTYVRKPGDPQTWLVSAEIEAPAGIKDWVSTAVFSTEVGKISRVTIAIPGEEPLLIERGPAPAKEASDATNEKDQPPATTAKLQFTGVPADGKKLKDANAADSIARAVASIDMEDVRKAEMSPAPDTLSTVTVEVADGPTSTLRLRKDGDAYWLTVAATGDGEGAKMAADDINKRAQGWEFKIPAHKAEAILKKRADLLETTS